MIFGFGIADPRRLSTPALQFLRFASVGLVATGAHYAILVSLVEVWKIHPVLATSVGFVAGVFVSYTLNRQYTFEQTPPFALGLAKYYVALSAGLAMNAITVAVLARWGFPYLVAQVVATGVVLVLNFLIARLVVFRS
ncbi:MAG: GtrA family protein [Rhodospirillales bacterium]|nr:GtrA family protein [Rhodospirillales bacterium]